MKKKPTKKSAPKPPKTKPSAKAKPTPKTQKKQAKTSREDEATARARKEHEADQKFLKIVSNKKTARAKLHALAQMNYSLRKKLAKTQDEAQKKKLRNKIIATNVEKEIVNKHAGIKTRRSTIEVKASERGRKAKGINTTFSFRNMKSAKENINNYLQKGVVNFNGTSANSPLDVLADIDNLFLSLDAYKEIRIVFNPDTGDLNVRIESTEDDEESEDESEE